MRIHPHKGFLFTTVFLLLSLHSFSQDETDALRLLGSTTGGTARSLGCGGAFSAVGADFSSAWLNPAGFGLYRKNELEFTAQLRLNSNTTTYLDQSGVAPKSNFSISNLGYVYTGKVRNPKVPGEYNETKFKSWSFSIGYNQIENYNRRTTVSAFNPINSIAEYFAANAQGIPAGVLTSDYSFASMAYNIGLIDTVGVDGYYLPAVRGNVQQDIDILESGKKSEWSVGFAGNISDKAFFGASIGIMDVKYQYDLVYKESDTHFLYNSFAGDSIPFSTLTFANSFRTRGSGVNAKIGLIVKPSDFFRIGISLTSPTWLNLKDVFASSLEQQIDNNSNVFGDELTEGFYEYNLFSPYKITVGGVYIYKKLGFISADFDFTDYANSKYRSNYIQSSPYYYSFENENAQIQRLFNYAYNYRVGAELRLSIFRIRAGFSQMGSILKKDFLYYPDYSTGSATKFAGGRKIFSLGFGLKLENFYLDLAIQREHAEDRQLFYPSPDPNEYSPELIRKQNSNKILLTTGFTF